MGKTKETKKSSTPAKTAAKKPSGKAKKKKNLPRTVQQTL